MGKKNKSFGSKIISSLNPLDPSKSTIRKILESSAYVADPLFRGLGLYKKGGRVGCGIAKRGFGKALRKK
jgi:hypothetical protein